ncbi:MarR family winged helix-turn-helix transcriptional regulator [Mycetocola reblochoni]|uniref:Transcriptional regulator, MarR family n=2 Tax=Mycetocola reblochoni TaxID=331618 RepID=A0A1R4IQW9_9MICO|nr:MarR family transcriptional regulator [Mycetocola reblochoni]RLP68416.1 MarR family transcriptional regulator [Mycetocola reblochoni]SJN21975.1 Transcriptional regulator, MarR family [Mycetocola reblochoni REB411]
MAATDGEIARALQRLVVETQRHVAHLAGAHGMHPTDLSAIGAILEGSTDGGPLTPGELSRRLELSAPATSAVINRLVGNSHVERHRNDDDRRSTTLQATETATAVGGALFAPLARGIAGTLDGLDDDERAVILRFLDDSIAAVARIDAELDGGGTG